MSKIALTGNASGTGVFTIASPNSNTDRTLTLPDEAGTVLTNTSGVAKTGDTMTGALEVQSGSGSQLKAHLTGVTTLGVGSAIDFQLTQTNAQSARLAQISTEFINAWGGDLVLSTKPANGNPDDSVLERVRIDSRGRVTMPYQPIASCSDSRAISLSSVVLDSSNFYDTVAVNRGNYFNASTGRFNCPVTGVYRIYLRITSSGGINQNIRLQKNGSTIREAYSDGSGNFGVSAEAIVNCVAGDYLNIQIATMTCLAGTQHKQVTFELIG